MIQTQRNISAAQLLKVSEILKAIGHPVRLEIMELLEELPPGYRTVFNLYVLEGFKHQEIADTLGISINTSKSQLILAKDRLRKLLTAKGYL